MPGVAQAEGQVKGAVADESDLAIARYDSLTADEINAACPSLSQIDLAKVDTYERRKRTARRSSNRIGTLRGDEPWAGYDELTVAEIRTALVRGRRRARQQVRDYERAHKNRAGVLEAAERQLQRTSDLRSSP